MATIQTNKVCVKFLLNTICSPNYSLYNTTFTNLILIALPVFDYAVFVAFDLPFRYIPT